MQSISDISLSGDNRLFLNRLFLPYLPLSISSSTASFASISRFQSSRDFSEPCRSLYVSGNNIPSALGHSQARKSFSSLCKVHSRLLHGIGTTYTERQRFCTWSVCELLEPYVWPLVGSVWNLIRMNYDI